MKITVEFNTWDEVESFAEKIMSIAAEPEADPNEANKPKRTRKAKDTPAASPTTNPTPGSTSNPLEGLTGGAADPLAGLTGDSGASDLDTMLGLAAPAKPKLDREQLRAKAGEIASAGGKAVGDKVVALLKSYNLKAISDLPEDKFVDFDTKLDLIKAGK